MAFFRALADLRSPLSNPAVMFLPSGFSVRVNVEEVLSVGVQSQRLNFTDTLFCNRSMVLLPPPVPDADDGLVGIDARGCSQDWP
jgi:hypothetical protein